MSPISLDGRAIDLDADDRAAPRHLHQDDHRPRLASFLLVVELACYSAPPPAPPPPPLKYEPTRCTCWMKCGLHCMVD
jgi:hypothetical protein